MAVTETYVDPAIAGNAGSGTINDPYGDLQFALDSMTRDAANGDRLNIKAGAAEILVATINLTSYGTPTEAAPLIFQGYSAIADDGGMGDIDGNGKPSIFLSSTLDHISWVDLNLHNTTGGIIRVDDFCLFVNCNFFDGGAVELLRTGSGCRVISCYFTEGSGIAVSMASSGYIANCTIRSGVSEFTEGINAGQLSVVENNVLILEGAAVGINVLSRDIVVSNNSIYSVNGTGQGLIGAGKDSLIFNNIIEGFSGIGGVGIAITGRIFGYGSNKFFNNTANEGTLDVVVDLGNNDILAESPFVDAANDDFRVNISVKALAYPTANFPDLSVRTYLDIGALQREEGATVVVPPVGVSLGRLYNVPAEDRIHEVLS